MTGMDLGGLSVGQLRARRRRLVSSLDRLEVMLPGSLVRQGRRCSSSGCHCRRGELHGPYLYLALYSEGRSRSVYVPAALEALVDEHVAVTARNEEALTRIAQINLELLRRRALG
jgi:hypothetical protein